jgi:hypothetical protein
MTFGTLIKQPSAFLPIVMSVGALATVLIPLATIGADAMRQPDEGAAAHMWQLLIAGQVPIVAFFAIKWLPRDPKAGLPVVLLQAIAGLAALAPVFLLGL